MLSNNFKKLRGFTLIELLVVIAIIGLLITFSAMALLRYQKTAADTRIEVDLSQVRNVAAMIYTDNNNYKLLCDQTIPPDDTLNNTDYKSLKIIEDDIISFTGQSVSCYAAGSKFCVQTYLVTEGIFYCIDYTGYIGEEAHCANNNKQCQE